MQISPALRKLRCETVDHVYDVELELMDNPNYVRVTANLLDRAMCGRMSLDRLNEVRDSYDRHLAQSTPDGSLGDWVFNAARF